MTKPRIDPVRWQTPPSRPFTETALIPTLTVVTVPGHAPEDVVVDAEGNVWTGVEDGRLIRIKGESTQVIADTRGRPLGLAAARDGSLLICDSQRGLLRLDPVTGEFETLVAEIAGRPLMFCSNVVESSCGTIYFTESTDRFRYEYYKGAVIEGRATGSLFRRDPDGTVTVLASGLLFANGVTLTADESAIVFAESTGRRLSKYWLTGARAASKARTSASLGAGRWSGRMNSDGFEAVRLSSVTNDSIVTFSPLRAATKCSLACSSRVAQ